MKLMKIASLFAAAALGLSAGRAPAAIVGHTTSYDVLNFSAVIKQIGTTNVSGTTTNQTITKTKFANKDLLNFLAKASSQTWSNGAQLEFDWNSHQVIVADQTGTNILYYAYDGVDNDTAYSAFDVEFGYQDNNLYTQKSTSSGYSYTQYYMGYFSLYYVNNFDASVYTDLWGYGESTEKGTYVYSTRKWTDSEVFKLSGGTGDLNNAAAEWNGVIKAKGKGAN